MTPESPKLIIGTEQMTLAVIDKSLIDSLNHANFIQTQRLFEHGYADYMRSRGVGTVLLLFN